MNITKDRIEEVLSSIDTHRKLWDMLAQMEKDRLSELVYVTLNEVGQDRDKTKTSLLEALRRSKEFFGNLHLSEMLDIDRVLEQIHKSTEV